MGIRSEELHNTSTATQLLSDEVSPLTRQQVLAERFVIEHFIGAGNFGFVYKAWDTVLNIWVAIKVLKTELAVDHVSLTAFRTELLLARKVSHPNVLRIHEFFQDECHAFYSMDWIEGQSLEQLLKINNLEESQAIDVLRQLADALHAAHLAEIVHCDVSAANVMMSHNGQVILMDFGLAQSKDECRRDVLFGSPQYMSPERLGGGKAEASGDIYALGVLLYQMLAAKVPFDAKNINELIQQKQRNTYDFPAKTSTWMKKLIGRLIAPNPAQRPQNMLEVMALVHSYSTRRARNVRNRITLASIVVLLVAGIGFYYYAISQIRVSPQHIAVLPLIIESQGKSEVASGAAERLEWLLLQQPLWQPVAHERITQTMANLQLEANRLSEGQLWQLAELFSVSVLLQGRILKQNSVSQMEFWVWRRTANGMNKDLLYSVPMEADSFWPELENVVAKITHTPIKIKQSLKPESLQAYNNSLSAISVNNHALAIQTLQQVIEDNPSFGEAYLLLARSLRLVGDIEKAATTLAMAQSINTELSWPMEKAELLVQRGELAQAIDILKSWLEQKPEDVVAQLMLAESLGAIGEFKQAQIILSDIVSHDVNHAAAWFLRAKFAIISGEVSLALEDYLVRALVIQRRLNNRVGEAEVLNAFGVAYQRLGSSTQAEKYYQEAVSLRTMLGDDRALATSLRNLADVLTVQGKRSEALAHLKDAEAAYQKLADKEGMAAVENSLGMHFEEGGQYREALSHYRAALQIHQQLNDPKALAESLSNVGYMFYLQSSYQDADVYWQQALVYYQQVGEMNGQLRVQQLMAQNALMRGNWDLATRLLNQTLIVAEQHDLQEEVSAAKAYLAQVYFLQGRFGAAFNTLALAAKGVESRNDIRGKLEFQLWRCEWLSTIADEEQAQSCLNQFAQLMQSHGSDEQRSYQQIIQSEILLNQGKTAAAKKQLKAILDPKTQWMPHVLAAKARVLLARSYLAEQDMDGYNQEARHIESYLRQSQNYPVSLAWISTQLLYLPTFDTMQEFNKLSAMSSASTGFWQESLFWARQIALDMSKDDIEQIKQRLNLRIQTMLHGLSETQKTQFLQRYRLTPPSILPQG